MIRRISCITDRRRKNNKKEEPPEGQSEEGGNTSTTSHGADPEPIISTPPMTQVAW